MEKGLKTAAAGLLLCVAVAAPAQEGPAKWLEDFEKKFPPVGKNAAAEDLERLSLALGLDPYGESGDDHPSKEDVEAYRQASILTWVDAQLKTSDESIASPPPRLAEFLEKRQATLWRVATLLGREVPEWGFDPREGPRERRDLLVVLFVGRILLAAALVEERGGHHGQAASLLESTWSLSRSVASEPDGIFLLIAVALGKLQAGVLRKMGEPAFEWTDRMSSDTFKNQMLESLEFEPLAMRARLRDALPGGLPPPWTRGWQAVADGLRKLSACEISHRPEEEIWKPANEEIQRWNEAGGEPGMETIQAIAAPNLTNTFRRVARLMVDRELTAKILELRIEKAVARPSRWPEKFFDAESQVCPGATYEYRSSGTGMSLRFAGSVADAGTPLVLPLSFEARAPRPTSGPSRTPRPTPTPTPRPSLTPARARA